ncbi:MAG: hypothetical protein H7141_02115 [Burkholderiales bacterium]|nr:hypothetical protein [Bacteroidia bacterium]
MKNVLHNINYSKIGFNFLSGNHYHFVKQFDPPVGGVEQKPLTKHCSTNNTRVQSHCLIHTTKLFLLILLYLITYNPKLNSQTLIPTAETAFESQLPFNTEYIKSQGIKSITFDIIDKKDMQVAVDKGLLNYYEFNSTGLLTRFYYTSIIKVIQKEFHSGPKYNRRKLVSNGYTYTKNEYVYDTVSTTYFYNTDYLLKLKRYNDGTYYESYYYDYTIDEKVEKEKRYKETNISENKSEFRLGGQYLISSESYSYQTTSKNQYKKTCLNDEGRPYKEIIYTLNDSKKSVSINEQYTVAWITQNSAFTYNAKGQLTKATYKSNSNGELEQLRTYDYDANDCLLTEKQFKNGILLKEISYVTDVNKKVNSYIIRDPNEKTIRIVKLFYRY